MPTKPAAEEAALSAEAMLADLTDALSRPAQASYWRAFDAEGLTGPGRRVAQPERDRCREIAAGLTDDEVERAGFDGCRAFKFRLEPSDRMWAGGHVRDALLDEAARRGYLRITPAPFPSLLEESSGPASPTINETLILTPLQRAEPRGASIDWSEEAGRFAARAMRLLDAGVLGDADSNLLLAHCLGLVLTPAQRDMLPEHCLRLLAAPLPDGLARSMAAASLSWPPAGAGHTAGAAGAREDGARVADASLLTECWLRCVMCLQARATVAPAD